MEKREVQEECRINSSSSHKVLYCVAVKPEFFLNRCFSEEHFYQAMVTTAIHDQGRLRHTLKQATALQCNMTVISPPGGEHLTFCGKKDTGVGKAGLCHTASLERGVNWVCGTLQATQGFFPHLSYQTSNAASNSTSGSHHPTVCDCLWLVSLGEASGNGISQSFSYPSGSQASVFSCHSYN